jgi:hypothetical protein
VVLKKLLQSCWSMWPNHKSSMYLGHLVGLWSAASNAVSSKCSITILLTTGE